MLLSDIYPPPQPLEKLKFYFGRFLINSLDFSIEIEVKNAILAQISINSLYSFLITFLILNVLCLSNVVRY